MQQTKKGFTLIELLVVIAIIGILSAIGLVSLNGAREKARDAQRKSDLSQIKTALVLYYDDNNSTYPAVAVANTAQSIESGAVHDALVTEYLSRMPTSPTATAEYFYNYIAPLAAANTNYALLAHLEAPGEEDIYVLNHDGFGGVVGRTTAGAANYTTYKCGGAAAGQKDVCVQTVTP